MAGHDFVAVIRQPGGVDGEGVEGEAVVKAVVAGVAGLAAEGEGVLAAGPTEVVTEMVLRDGAAFAAVDAAPT